MKILFVGDYSKLHATLAETLSRRGHEVTVLSDGCSHMGVACDIFLKRRPGFLGSLRYIAEIAATLPRLRGYDVVQLVNPHFLNLRPEKLRPIFRRLKRDNGSIFLSLAGNDSLFVRKCLDGHTFRFSEFRVGDRPTEFAARYPERERGYLLPEVVSYCDWFYDNIDGGMAVLPEYYMAAREVLGERLCHTNLPADLRELPQSEFRIEGKVKLLVGMRSGYVVSKGTDTLLALARNVESRLPDIVETVNVRDLPWAEYRKVLTQCHINLDQLYSYSPAMNALSSMALGRIAASGAQPEYYDIIGEKDLHPVFSLSPLEEDMEERLCRLLTDPARMEAMARDSRRLVERHNSVEIVADRYESHWNKLLRL